MSEEENKTSQIELEAGSSTQLFSSSPSFNSINYHLKSEDLGEIDYTTYQPSVYPHSVVDWSVQYCFRKLGGKYDEKNSKICIDNLKKNQENFIVFKSAKDTSDRTTLISSQNKYSY
jgi:hypothetical protein